VSSKFEGYRSSQIAVYGSVIVDRSKSCGVVCEGQIVARQEVNVI
jgi:hypothetical protein